MSRFLKGLPAQLLLATILPLTLVLSGIAFAGVYLHHHSMRQLVSERDLRAVMATAEMLERAIPPNQDGSLSLSNEQFDRLVNPLQDHQRVIAFLVNQTGQVLLHTDGAQIGMSATSHGGVTEALRGEHGVLYRSDAPGHSEHVISYSSVRIANTQYGLVIEEPWEEVVDPMMTYSLVTPLILLPVLLLAAIGLVLGMRRIVRPLQQLQQQARAASGGHLEALTQPVDGIEEIEELQTTLNAMTLQIQSDQERMRHYAHAVVQAQEQERKRLAHELHDDTIQNLIALSQRIQSFKLQMQKGKMTSVSELNELRHSTLGMIDDIRRLSRALRPIYLEEAGLICALERLVCEANERGGTSTPPFRVLFESSGNIARLDADTELSLFRIAQEATNNAIKHAQATVISLSLKLTHDGVLQMLIHDNGHGFDTAAPSAGLGLIGIRERAAAIRATMSVDSAPMHGTHINVIVPQS